MRRRPASATKPDPVMRGLRLSGPLRCALILVAVLAAVVPAAAGWRPEVRVLRSGLYQLDKDKKLYDEKGCPTVNVIHVNGTHYVPDAIFSRFGFEFNMTAVRFEKPKPVPATPLIGQLYATTVAEHEARALRDGLLTPPGQEPVPRVLLLTARITHPPIKSPIRGGLKTADVWEFPVCPDVPAFVGWEFTFDWERSQGVWDVELLYEDRVLAKERFQSVPKDFRGNMNLSYSFRSRGQGADRNATSSGSAADESKVGTNATITNARSGTAAPVAALAVMDNSTVVETQSDHTVAQNASLSNGRNATGNGAGGGVRRLRIKVRKEPDDVAGEVLCLLVGTEESAEGAQRHASRLQDAGYPAFAYSAANSTAGEHHVLLGPYEDKGAARTAAAGFLALEGRPVRIVPECGPDH